MKCSKETSVLKEATLISKHIKRPTPDRFTQSYQGKQKVLGTAFSRSSDMLEKLDLTDYTKLEEFIVLNSPSIVIHCAAERRPDGNHFHLLATPPAVSRGQGLSEISLDKVYFDDHLAISPTFLHLSERIGDGNYNCKLQVATLSDTALEQVLNQQTLYQTIYWRIHRPKRHSHSFRGGKAHPHAHIINILFSVGEAAISAIHSVTPANTVIPHMDINARIKVLTRQIVIYKSTWPTHNRTNGGMAKYLQIRQLIEQDFFDLESCFTTQKEFSNYT
ncbi:hypothetical protein HDV02_002446 [Globomyces sp. JEL0801]|nr:hypothetical protein HDV02_002446 [Globomyces sp. JEL0801]